MASFSGTLQRPLSAVAAVVFAAASTDFLPDWFISGQKSLEVISPSGPCSSGQEGSLISQISDPKHSIISFKSKVGTMVNWGTSPSVDLMFSSPSRVAPPHALIDLYHFAKLANPSKTYEFSPQIPYSSSDGLYRWHFPDPNADGMLGKLDCSSTKSQTVVVLLGWLGAKQKHLKRYAEWYTSRGFHVVTFTFPMSEIISYKAGGKAEVDLELLAEHLADWVTEENGKSLVFHTFSNTGWLTYGVILEKFQKHDPSVIGKIKGCIVDSAPVAAPDPQVWASGFSAAFLKKQSVATKGVQDHNIAEKGAVMNVNSPEQAKTTVFEATLLNLLEKFFDVVFKLPTINRRLSDVLKLLSIEQPKCPQLYIYSSADRVIPADSVESFVEKQRSAGYEVRACNFGNSPHVDHFRNYPSLYSLQLTSFLEDCVLARHKVSS